MTTIGEAFAGLEPASVNSATRAADPLDLSSATTYLLDGLVKTAQASYPNIAWHDAEEAISEAIVELLESKKEFGEGAPWGLVVTGARWILQRIITHRKLVLSVEGLYATTGDDAFAWARPVRPEQAATPPLNSKQAEIVETLEAFRDQHGRAPMQRECGQEGLSSIDSIRHHFGNFNTALRAAQLTPARSPRRKWERDEVVAVLREYKRQEGGYPSSRELELLEHLPLPDVLRRFFGTSSPAKYGPLVDLAGKP